MISRSRKAPESLPKFPGRNNLKVDEVRTGNPGGTGYARCPHDLLRLPAGDERRACYVSPLAMEKLFTDMLRTSAPSRLPASSKELCVRVEASKNS
jgi:hypothetical protein